MDARKKGYKPGTTVFEIITKNTHFKLNLESIRSNSEKLERKWQQNLRFSIHNTICFPKKKKKKSETRGLETQPGNLAKQIIQIYRIYKIFFFAGLYKYQHKKLS